MELMNREVAKLKELTFNTATLFKQEATLVAAIDKLVNGTLVHLNGYKEKLLLPERKLNFSEVQQLLQQSVKHKTIEKSSDVLLKEANDNRKSIIKKIENILNEINTIAENGEVPKLSIRNQRLWSNCIYDLDRVTLKAIRDAKKTTLSYSSCEDKSRFNAIVFVLTKVHELLSKKITVTRREMFYQNIARFRNQANLDIAVRDVCCLLETPPWSLGIVATAKGLIAGPLTMHSQDGSAIDCMTSGGVLIPQDVNGLKNIQSTAKYILVVEKDAIFQKLLDEGALVRLGPVIIITGKGYPDVCTRQLLCRLCNELNLKALALVDADPHGYEIFLTYKYGSLWHGKVTALKLSRDVAALDGCQYHAGLMLLDIHWLIPERDSPKRATMAQSHLSSNLACGSLVLLGVRQHDVMTLAPNEARLPLSNLDRRKLVNLIWRPYLENAVGLRIKEEFNAMLTSGIKAEIEAVAPNPGALCDVYLPSKIILSDYLG